MIFLVNQDLYGVESRAVREVIWIPELFWNPALPPSLAGVFSYHGTVVPVLDLHQWFGGEPRKLRMTQQVIVVEWKERLVGLVVDKVEDVTSLIVEQSDTASRLETVQGSAVPGVVGLGKIDDQLVKMLDLSVVLEGLDSQAVPGSLDSLPSGLSQGVGQGQGQGAPWSKVSSRGFEQMTEDDRHLLQERTDALAQRESTDQASKWITLAVVRLNEEYIGLDPLVVREFAELEHCVPIPCCPDFVLGHMNLRGEVLTLFDLRSILNMPIPEDPPLTKVAVVQIDTCIMGIAVHEVLDCISCRADDGVPAEGFGEAAPFLKVGMQYRGRTLKLLDVPQLIASGVLEVYEEA